ncbi:MAG: DUF1800 family protein, partial [Candidatus Rokuibacteriota bacterium]
MTRWRIGLAVVAVGLLLDGCGVAHERGARSVVPDTPVGLAVGSRIPLPPTTLDPDRRVFHVLNRLAYGPRPGDLERVQAMGLAAWIERQFEPERIPDELVERRLGAYPTLRMTTTQLFQEFPRPDPATSARRREAMLRGEGVPAPRAFEIDYARPRPRSAGRRGARR